MALAARDGASVHEGVAPVSRRRGAPAMKQRRAAISGWFSYVVLALTLLVALLDVGVSRAGHVQALMSGGSLAHVSVTSGEHQHRSTGPYCAESVERELDADEGCEAPPLSEHGALAQGVYPVDLFGSARLRDEFGCARAHIDGARLTRGTRVTRGPPSAA